MLQSVRKSHYQITHTSLEAQSSKSIISAELTKWSFPAAQRHMCLSKKGYLSLQKYPPSWRTGTVACFQFLTTPSVLGWLLNRRRFQPPCFDLALKVWLHLSLSVYLLMMLPWKHSHFGMCVQRKRRNKRQTIIKITHSQTGLSNRFQYFICYSVRTISVCWFAFRGPSD